MKSIDEKIDIILRQKLLMGYKPELNLNENYEQLNEAEPRYLTNKIARAASNYAISQGLKRAAATTAARTAATTAATNAAATTAATNAAATTAVGVTGAEAGAGSVAAAAGSGLGLTAITGIAAASLGGIAGLFLIANFVQGWGRKGPKERISFYCTFCKEHANPTNYDANKIRKIANDLYTAYRAKGFLGSGLGTDEEGAYAAFGKLESWDEFCALVKVFENNYNKRLYDYIKNEHWRTVELMKILNIITPLFERRVREQIIPITNCLINLIKRRFNPSFTITTPIPSGGFNIPGTDTNLKNPVLIRKGGIKIFSLVPNAEGLNWRTNDSTIKGFTRCAQNGCVEFVDKATNKIYLIDHCYRAERIIPNPDRSCPNGYQPPLDGVYKLCTSGQPVIDMQKCLNINPDGKFGRSTLNALSTQKNVTQFTAQDVARLCDNNIPIPNKSDFDWLEGEDLTIQEF